MNDRRSGSKLEWKRNLSNIHFRHMVRQVKRGFFWNIPAKYHVYAISGTTVELKECNNCKAKGVDQTYIRESSKAPIKLRIKEQEASSS